MAIWISVIFGTIGWLLAFVVLWQWFREIDEHRNTLRQAIEHSDGSCRELIEIAEQVGPELAERVRGRLKIQHESAELMKDGCQICEHISKQEYL